MPLLTLRRPMRRYILVLGVALPGVACDGGTGGQPPGETQPAEVITDSATAADTLRVITPAGQAVTGWEAFISIGGVNGLDTTAVMTALVQGYRRAGFRVHYVVAALSFDPFSAQMAQIAREYVQLGRNLEWVMFHHTGHGWDDHISYQRGSQGGSTTHVQVATRTGARFPAATPRFANTSFGLVYDACGQGTATASPVPGRSGFVATATPDAAPAAQCQANACTYVCDACWTQTTPAYTYSRSFGPSLRPPPSAAYVDEAVQAAHNAGLQGIVVHGSPSGCSGKFARR